MDTWIETLIFYSNNKYMGKCSIESKNNGGISSQVYRLFEKYSF